MVQYRMVLQSIVPKTEYDGTGLTVVLRFWLAKCAGVWGSGRLLSTDSGCKPPSEPSKPNPEDREISRLRSPAPPARKGPPFTKPPGAFCKRLPKNVPQQLGRVPFPPNPGPRLWRPMGAAFALLFCGLRGLKALGFCGSSPFTKGIRSYACS